MGLCSSCRNSKARFRDKGTKICTSLHSAVSPLHPPGEDNFTNQISYYTPTIVQSNSSTKLFNGSMSNMIKGLVSKRRNRYKEDGFNLDLTYITDKIIAMGFPASNIEGVYRNHIDDVSKFLEAKHKDHYKIYNLCSERSYDISKFHNRVEVFPFDDHNPPKLELIEPFCNSVQQWLDEHNDNVAVVHCKAGKGRTGTMICCYLLHSKLYKSEQDALNYYGKQRTQDRKGVTIPSQLRYVKYYSRIIQETLKYVPVSLYIREIILEPPPTFAGGQGCVSFSISQQVLNEREGQCRQTCNKMYKSGLYEIKKGLDVFSIDLECCLPIQGDFKVEFYNKKIRKEKQFQFWLNTFFVAHSQTDNDKNGVFSRSSSSSSSDSSYTLTLKKNELDIIHKKDKQNKVYAPDFKVTVIFNKVPTKSSSWMGTPPKEPPTVPIDSTPSESSEAETTEDESGDEDDWDSVNERENLDPREIGYRHLSECDLTFPLTPSTSRDQHTELLTT